jgi:hypothetical protein
VPVPGARKIKINHPKKQTVVSHFVSSFSLPLMKYVWHKVFGGGACCCSFVFGIAILTAFLKCIINLCKYYLNRSAL